MSKSKITLVVVAGLAVLGGGAYVAYRFLDIPSLIQQELTAEIPTSRPERLDSELLERFSGQSMKQILQTLQSESVSTEPTPSTTAAEDFLAALPDAPYPFPADAAATDAAALKEFVTNLQQGSAEAPNDEEKHKFRLALAGLHVDPEQIPEALRSPQADIDEPDSFSVSLENRKAEFAAPLTFGNFDSDPETEIISHGGTSIYQISGNTSEAESFQIEVTVPGNGLYPADFDGDGDLDLFLTRPNGYPNSLLRNKGNQSFEDITIETGLLSFEDTTAAAWIDYDGDGMLDLLVGSSDHPLELYHQTESGTFQPVAWDLKLWVHKGVSSIEAEEVSGDGLTDFYLGLEGQEDRFYVTKSAPTWEEWRFENIFGSTGLAKTTEHGAAVHFIDFDRDGDSDIIQIPPASPIRLLHNTGDLSFPDVTEEASLPTDLIATSVTSSDIDNDGFDEIFFGTPPLQTNRVFWNSGGTGFKEISIVSGFSYLDSPSSFFSTDFDADGHIDLFYTTPDNSARWLEPQGATENWVHLTITEFEPATEISITVRDGDWVKRTITRQLKLRGEISVGLGNANSIEMINIQRPDEESASGALNDIAPNQSVSIDLPKRPKRRAIVPMTDGNSASTEQ